ncbi:cupin domain-containing protein [Sphingomonas morindae]|uniref:Cupin domain-containing protein n=1 Tax=Sphingomonas morindae TaxID=1541170 RepID=A0ABY4XB38_9SPHN|nr:cupin domain-containing protein [Sphingomonas morindae]USI74172.1 cupin domain-containing protein [Sphingomonas morindae]
MDSARDLIETLALSEHPEGGWYRETWRAEAAPGIRPSATAILFLLEAGQRSHWHRVDAAEIWLWHAGAPLTLRIAAADSAGVEAVTLGGDVRGGARPQQLVPAYHWQAAEADQGGWSLVSCIVSPGFDFAGFTLAPPDWAPGA